MKRRAAVFWFVVWALAGPPPRWAGALGLRSPAKEIVVEGLEPGKSYSLKALTGRPLSVENAGEEAVSLELSGGPPSGGDLRDGYEPVPSGSWLSIAEPRHQLKAGESAASDAVLTIPRGRRLRGGRYQLQWVGRARDASGRSLSLGSRLLLHVAPQPSGWRGEAPPLVGVKLLTPQGRAEAVSLGRTVDLRSAHGVRLKAANAAETRRRLVVRPVETPDELLPPGEGWERAPNPGFLSVAEPELSIGPDAVGEARLRLRIPDQERYRGRRWVFTVVLEGTEPGGPRGAPFRLFVTTPGVGLRR